MTFSLTLLGLPQFTAAGNQITRVMGGVTYTFTYSYEYRLTALAGGSVSVSFVYDADGN